MALGPLVKENVSFVCLTCRDSPRFRKASQESEEKLCLLPMLRPFSRYRDSKGIRWSMYSTCMSSSKMPAKGRLLSMQLLATDEKKGREVGSKCVVAAPSPRHYWGCLGVCCDVSKLGVVISWRWQACFSLSQREALAEQPLSKGNPNQGFVRWLLFCPFCGKTGKEIQPQGFTWPLSIAAFTKPVPKP